MQGGCDLAQPFVSVVETVHASSCARFVGVCRSRGGVRRAGGAEAARGGEGRSCACADRASAGPAPEIPELPETPETIVGIDSAVTSTGLPQHVRFSLRNPGASAVVIELSSLVFREGESGTRALVVREQQLWKQAADTPITIAAGEALTLEAGGAGELLVYLDRWEADPMAEAYAFVGEFRVDAEQRTVPVSIQRARREPLRR